MTLLIRAVAALAAPPCATADDKVPLGGGAGIIVIRKFVDGLGGEFEVVAKFGDAAHKIA